MAKNHTEQGLARIYNAFCWSIAGLKTAFLHEAAFRQECILVVILAPLGGYIGGTPVEKAVLIGVLLIVLVVELMNSAIEAVVDRIGEEPHVLAGRAKDLGSAAVFVAILNAISAWFFVLFGSR